MNASRFYKIRNRSTGLYSTGGGEPGWSTRGKTWATPGHVKLHMHQVNFKAYRNCDLVAFEHVEREVASMEEFIRGVDEAKRAGEEQRKRAQQQRVETEERRTLARLKEKYG